MNDEMIEEHILLEFPEYEGSDLLTKCKEHSFIVWELVQSCLYFYCFTNNYSKGLDSDAPILKLDNMIFRGRWTESIGTNMYFTDTSQGDEKKPETFHCTSTKILQFHRVVLEKKDNE